MTPDLTQPYWRADAHHAVSVEIGDGAVRIFFDKNQAAVYEAPISEAEPAHFAPAAPTFVLRHFICPHCAVWFGVDMLPAGEPSPRSVELA